MAESINYNNTIKDIKNNKVNLCLFYGPETMLIDNTLVQLTDSLLNPSFKNLNYIKLDGAAVTYDSIVNACETLPFMDVKKIVVISECNFFKSKKSKKNEGQDDNNTENLCSYFSKIPETIVLILIVKEEIDKRNKIYNCIKKYGNIMEFTPLKGMELTEWIQTEFRKRNKTIGKADIGYFAERAPQNLNDITNEIDKLCSYVGKKDAIVKSDIEAVVSKSLDMNVFQLIDSISAKNASKALMVLNELILDSEPIPVILTMIIRQFRLLLNAKLMMKKGYSAGEIAEKLNLKPYVASNIIKLSQGSTEEILIKRMERCLDTDAAIKRGRLEQRIAIESLIVEFSS